MRLNNLEGLNLYLARSSIAVNIRNQGDQHDEAYSIDSESEEPELQEKNFETPKHEPKIIRKVSNTSLSSGYQSQSPSERKQLNALRGLVFSNSVFFLSRTQRLITYDS